MGGFTPGQPITLPYGRPQQGPDIWERAIQAFMMGLQEKRAKEAFQSQMEDRKMQRDYTIAQIKAAEREDAIKARQADMGMMQFMQGMPSQSFTPPTPQQEIPGMAMDFQGGMSPSTYEPMQGGQPQQTSYLPHALQTETMGTQFVPGQQEMLLQALQQFAAKSQVEAEAAGTKTTMEERAKAPFTAAKLQAEQGFTAGQNDLDRQTRMSEGKLNRGATLGAAQMNLQATEGNRRTERENKLADDYTRDMKDFYVMDDQISRVREFSKNPTGASDMGLIYSYMKMLDPGSTVREGEYATAQNSGSIPERVRAAYNKALKGERLDPKVRTDFVGAAERAYNAVQVRRNGLTMKYQDRAKRMGVDPSVFEVLKPGGTPGGGACNGVPTPDGKCWKLVNGQYVEQ